MIIISKKTMSSPNRSASIPLSCENDEFLHIEFYEFTFIVDRFRVKSIQFLSPFRHPSQPQIRIEQTTGKHEKYNSYFCRFESKFHFRTIMGT